MNLSIHTCKYTTYDPSIYTQQNEVINHRISYQFINLIQFSVIQRSEVSCYTLSRRDIGGIRFRNRIDCTNQGNSVREAIRFDGGGRNGG